MSCSFLTARNLFAEIKYQQKIIEGEISNSIRIKRSLRRKLIYNILQKKRVRCSIFRSHKYW